PVLLIAWYRASRSGLPQAVRASRQASHETLAQRFQYARDRPAPTLLCQYAVPPEHPYGSREDHRFRGHKLTILSPRRAADRAAQLDIPELPSDTRSSVARDRPLAPDS